MMVSTITCTATEAALRVRLIPAMAITPTTASTPNGASNPAAARATVWVPVSVGQK